MVHDRILTAISKKKFVTPMYIANRLNIDLILVKEICRILVDDKLVIMSKNYRFKKI